MRKRRPGYIGKHGRRGRASSISCVGADIVFRKCKPNPARCWLLVLNGETLMRGMSKEDLILFNVKHRIGGTVVREGT